MCVPCDTVTCFLLSADLDVPGTRLKCSNIFWVVVIKLPHIPKTTDLLCGLPYVFHFGLAPASQKGMTWLRPSRKKTMEVFIYTSHWTEPSELELKHVFTRNCRLAKIHNPMGKHGIEQAATLVILAAWITDFPICLLFGCLLISPKDSFCKYPFSFPMSPFS